MNIWVYDIETYPNYFLIHFYNITTGEELYFEISAFVNDEKLLQDFLKTKNLQLIGFNNINFDYPLLHCTILRKSNNTSESINIEANRIIKAKYSAIWDNQIKIPQLDLYKIWHYDNKNKATSLKWLEFAMRSHDVRDLPYTPGSILTKQQMDDVKLYCRHDVQETYKFFLKSKKHIEIRQFYSQLEGINLINASEIKMSKEIFKIGQWLKGSKKFIIQNFKGGRPLVNNSLKNIRSYSREELNEMRDIASQFFENVEVRY